jgi:hypothetical protein
VEELIIKKKKEGKKSEKKSKSDDEWFIWIKRCGKKRVRKKG